MICGSCGNEDASRQEFCGGCGSTLSDGICGDEDQAEWLAGVGRADQARSLFDETRGILEALEARPWLERPAQTGAPIG